jgi:hypothetical protein
LGGIKGFSGLDEARQSFSLPGLRVKLPLKNMKKEIHDEITHKIIGSAMKVHSTMGNGFQEVIYQRCLAIEMGKQELSFVREQEMPYPIFYF